MNNIANIVYVIFSLLVKLLNKTTTICSSIKKYIM